MSLAEKIVKRNQDAIDDTKRILSDYSIIFDEVFKHMCQDEMTAEWLNVDFHRNTSALLDLIGAAKYKAGTIMKGDGEEVIYIDENNMDNYITHMRVILPLVLVEDADIDGIIEFVGEYSELVLSTSQDEMDLMVADEAFLKKYFKCFKKGVLKPHSPKIRLTKTEKKPTQYEGFDLTDMDLDENQIKMLLLFRPEGQA